MPRNAMQAMIDAVPESLMKGAEGRCAQTQPCDPQHHQVPLSTKPSVQIATSTEVAAGSTRAIRESTRPQKHRCAQIDAQDAKDRAELAQNKLAQVELSKRRKEKGETK